MGETKDMYPYGNRFPLAKTAAVAASVLASVTLVACGSSSPTKPAASGNSNAPSKAPTFTGTPVKVQINTAIGTQFGSYPGSIAAVKAAARAVNAEGGISGHEVVVATCNTQINPNQELACGRETVSNGAIATVSSLILTSGKDYLDTLNKAGIVDIGSEVVQPVFAQATNSYPITFDFGAFASCTGPDLTKVVGGNRIVAVYPDIPAAAPLQQVIESSAKKQGSTYAGSVPVANTVTDYAPVVQKIADLKPNVVIQIGGSAQVAALLQQAALTGRNLTVCSPVASNISPALVGAGPAANNFYLAQAIPPLSAADSIPGLKTFKDQMAAELAAGDKDADIAGTKGSDPNEVQTWLAMQVFIKAAKSVQGDITPQSFKAALDKTQFAGMGIIGDIDFSKPASGGPYTRIFNPTFQLQKWNVTAKQFELIPNTSSDTVKVLFGS